MPKTPAELYKAEVSRLAAECIGAPDIPPEARIWRRYAAEAQAYHEGRPYPGFAYSGWLTEERGPIPQVQPFVKGIPRKSAKWLFGQPVTLVCEESEEYQEFIRTLWQLNRMPTRMVAAAEMAAVTGAVGLKFGYDEGRPGTPVSIGVIKPWHYTCFRHPHDVYTVLMVRIQYPVWDAKTGQVKVHREEWTAEEYVEYELHDAPSYQYDWASPTEIWKSAGMEVGQGSWQVHHREPNRFGVIPFVDVWNIDRGLGYGCGDMFGMYRIVDEINLTRQLENVHNQKNVHGKPILIDLEPENDEQEHVAAPGEPISVRSSGEKQGKVDQLATDAAIRPHMQAFARDLMKDLLDAVGSVILDEEHVTNKGNLTQAVMTQMYGPLILSTEEKRKTEGEDGICKFLESLAVGLTNMGVSEGPGEVDVTCHWPDYFELTDDDRARRVDRYTKEMEAGFMPYAIAVEKVAIMEGVEDIEKYVADALAEKDEREAEAKAEAAKNSGVPPDVPGND